MTDASFDLARFPVHLGLGATVVPLAEFDGTPEWYERYATGHAADGAEGRLVSLHTFTEPWDSWEMHPAGAELVACVEGRITLHQEIDGTDRTVVLDAGQAVVNPPGVWHTADVDARATAMFVTAGMGTEVRTR
jgi:mannose-6-phosphate isomerase-like protein (cupin superfamily)